MAAAASMALDRQFSTLPIAAGDHLRLHPVLLLGLDMEHGASPDRDSDAEGDQNGKPPEA
ncbi:hypothetical protein [Novosphingobium lindaniclasticum]|uniref:hypothetical protein n=1 Tax=Novosphingobium lindaniclasticum TaxID=1329895 RepID=UPI002409ECA4|nr:hypothetical protein [Novosphingobium lindaniclasticum]